MTKPMGIRQVLIHLNKIALGVEKTETLSYLWTNHVSKLSNVERSVLMWIMHRAFDKKMRLFSLDLDFKNIELESFMRVLDENLLYDVHQDLSYLKNFRGHSPWLDEAKTLRLSHKIKFFGVRRCALGLPALRLLKGIEKGQTLVVSPKHFTIKNGVIHPR